jgi:hypothetical protein
MKQAGVEEPADSSNPVSRLGDAGDSDRTTI